MVSIFSFNRGLPSRSINSARLRSVCKISGGMLAADIALANQQKKKIFRNEKYEDLVGEETVGRTYGMGEMILVVDLKIIPTGKESRIEQLAGEKMEFFLGDSQAGS